MYMYADKYNVTTYVYIIIVYILNYRQQKMLIINNKMCKHFIYSNETILYFYN